MGTTLQNKSPFHHCCQRCVSVHTGAMGPLVFFDNLFYDFSQRSFSPGRSRGSAERVQPAIPSSVFLSCTFCYWSIDIWRGIRADVCGQIWLKRRCSQWQCPPPLGVYRIFIRPIVYNLKLWMYTQFYVKWIRKMSRNVASHRVLSLRWVGTLLLVMPFCSYSKENLSKQDKQKVS